MELWTENHVSPNLIWTVRWTVKLGPDFTAAPGLLTPQWVCWFFGTGGVGTPWSMWVLRSCPESWAPVGWSVSRGRVGPAGYWGGVQALVGVPLSLPPVLLTGQAVLCPPLCPFELRLLLACWGFWVNLRCLMLSSQFGGGGHLVAMGIGSQVCPPQREMTGSEGGCCPTSHLVPLCPAGCCSCALMWGRWLPWGTASFCLGQLRPFRASWPAWAECFYTLRTEHL